MSKKVDKTTREKGDKWTRRVKMKRISRYAMIFCLVFLVMLAGFSLYGSKLGNFVVMIDDSEVKITASVSDDLKNQSTRFVVPGIENQNPATLTDIPVDISSGMGEKGIKSDNEMRRYIAFSFYLLNKSDFKVYYDFKMDVTDTARNKKGCRIVDVLRVMVIEGDKPVEEGKIYAKPEDTFEAEQALAAKIEYTATPFLNDKQLIQEKIEDFQPNASVKYTVVVWMEGWDVQCTEELFGDSIRMQLSIQAHKYA